MNENWLTLLEAAKLLHVTRQQIILWIRLGKLPASRFGRQDYRVQESDFLAFKQASRLSAAQARGEA